MKAIYIAFKDLKTYFKDIKNLAFAIALPIAVIAIAGFALGAAFSPPEALIVTIVNKDKGSIANDFVQTLKKSKDLKVEETTEIEAKKMVKDGERGAAIIIPEGFTKSISNGEGAKLILYQDPSDISSRIAIEGLAKEIVTKISGTMISTSVAVEQIIKSSPSIPINITELAKGAEELSLNKWANPPVKLETESIGVERKTAGYTFEDAVPGYAVMFTLLSVMLGSMAIIEERRTKTLSRILVSPTSKSTVLFGKYVGTYLQGGIQIIILFLVGHFIFGMRLGNSIFALVLLTALLVAVASSLSILIASLARTTSQASSISVFTVLVMSALGGSWWPLDITPPFMQKIGHFTVNAWAMDGYQLLLAKGMGLKDIWLDIVVLLAMAIVFLILAIIFFRFTEEK